MNIYMNATVGEGQGLEEPFSEPDPNLISVATWYWYVHPYVSLVVCAFGITTNVFNIVILSHRDLRSPTNCILCGIAFSDMCLMTCYVPFVIYFYILRDLTSTTKGYSLGWTNFLIFHSNLTAVLHLASIWLAVYLVVFRYFCLKGFSSRAKYFQVRSTCIVISVIVIFSTLAMLPSFMMTQSEEHDISSNETLFQLKDFEIGSSNPNPLALLMFWIYAIVGKIIPSVLIAIFAGMLLNILSNMREQYGSLNSAQVCQRARQDKRTTLTLLTITVLYLVTELPQGIMILICCYVEGFFQNVYMPLGDIMDIIALINNAVNFILYCSTSERFRMAFLEKITKCGAKNNWHSYELDVFAQRGTSKRTAYSGKPGQVTEV